MKRLIVMLLLLAAPVWAVEPSEVLEDPAMEARAREISKGLRCLVCRNESIDDSNASLAKDLRILVRERLVAGDSDEEVVDFVVDRYGEYVLLKPLTGGTNWILWAAGPGMLVIGGLVGFAFVRRRSGAVNAGEEALSADEQARLDKILND